MVENIFKGLGVALITPFKPNGDIDVDSLERLVDFLITEGVDFICELGTTAETPCLTSEEKQLVRQTVARVNNHRVPLLLGMGGNCTSMLVDEIKSDSLADVDGILSVCPFYNKPTQAGLTVHFTEVAKASQKPVVIYNIPGRTGVNMQASTLLNLVKTTGNIVAVKEASGNIGQIADILEDKPEGFDVLSGDDAIAFELIGLGAAGCVSVVGNAFPKSFGQMLHLQMQGRETEALSIYRKFLPLCKLLFADGNPGGIKQLLSLQGKIENVLRPPLVPVNDSVKAELANWLKDNGK